MAGAPPRRPDLDLADVFGGPPRRSSGNEHRPRRGLLDSPSVGSAPRARSGGVETPVFGDRGSSDRRKQLGKEFYRGIFPGSEAASPRRAGAGDWGDVFGRTASPGSTTRPRSSFSLKFCRDTDSSMPTSPSRQTTNRNDDGTSYAYSVPTSPNSQMNNYLAHQAPQRDSRKKPFSWHRYPFLSRFRSQSGEKKNASSYVSSIDSDSIFGCDPGPGGRRQAARSTPGRQNPTPGGAACARQPSQGAIQRGPECEGTPIGLESIMANNKFHFSFFKWAGKGALLMLPANTQENAGDIIGLRSFPQVVVQGIDLIIDEEESMSTATGASKSQTDYEASKSGKHSTNSASSTKEGAISLFYDDYMQGGNAEEAGMKHSTDYTKNDVSSASSSAKSSRSPLGEKSRGSRVKGKVKGFMKIFSTEDSPKLKAAQQTQDPTSTGKNGSKRDLQDKFSISSAEANEDVKTAQMNNQKAYISAPYPMSEVQETMDKPVLTANSKMETKMDTTPERTEAVSTESVRDDTKAKVDITIEHGERHVKEFDGCVVEHFCEDPVLHDDQEKDQIKIAESKIREWSRGKEGNIRSLLSTLQYVLWPESGWKPIPLVDVIEGAAVKKAYQKALLCLHPDKLQQRGAAMHQKYIAEKVFDILQESWKEFNSVTFG